MGSLRWSLLRLTSVRGFPRLFPAGVLVGNGRMAPWETRADRGPPEDVLDWAG